MTPYPRYGASYLAKRACVNAQFMCLWVLYENMFSIVRTSTPERTGMAEYQGLAAIGYG